MDAVFKQIDRIVKELIEPEKRRVKQLIIELTERNNELLGVRGTGFVHKGVNYVASVSAAPIRPALHQRLLEDGDSIYEQLNIRADDQQQIRQQLYHLLSRCEDFQDIRDALPDTLRDAFIETQNLPRTREEAWVLKDEPRLMAQYLKVADMISYYSATRLVF